MTKKKKIDEEKMKILREVDPEYAAYLEEQKYKMTPTEEAFYNYFMQQITKTLREIASTTRKQVEICKRLRMLRRAITAIGTNQLGRTPEGKRARKELVMLVEKALREAGCI